MLPLEAHPTPHYIPQKRHSHPSCWTLCLQRDSADVIKALRQDYLGLSKLASIITRVLFRETKGARHRKM